jgi:hypothetical protein
MTVIEGIYRQPDMRNLSTEMAKAFEKDVTKLYFQVLKYQAQFVCRSRLAIVQIGRDILKLDGWDSLLLDIKKSEEACMNYTKLMDSGRLETEQDSKR